MSTIDSENKETLLRELLEKQGTTLYQTVKEQRPKDLIDTWFSKTLAKRLRGSNEVPIVYIESKPVS